MRRLALALLLLPAGAWAYNATGNEDRCEELGAACICSEPHNFTGSVLSSPGSCDGFNAIDSPDTTAKECKYAGCDYYRGTAWATDPPVGQRASVATPFPTGADPYIISAHWGGVQQLYQPGVDTTLDHETACDRIYNRFKKVRWPSPSGAGRIKSLIQSNDILPPGLFRFNFQWEGFASPGTEPVMHWEFVTAPGLTGAADQGGTLSPTLTIDQCADSWCRFEVCVDHGGTTIQVRYYATEIKVGGNVEHSAVYPSSPTSVVGPITVRGFLAHPDLFVQNGDFDWGVASPRYYFSHGLYAKVAYDPTFKIGAASELETPPATDVTGKLPYR